MAELGQLLDEAKKIITGERQDSYGSPEDSFARIAGYWSTYLGRAVKPREVAEMMILFKLARMQGQKPHRDNYVDAAGYLSIAADKMLETRDAAVVVKHQPEFIQGERRA